MRLANKNVVVFGLGKSGRELVDFLCYKKANVFVYDDKAEKVSIYLNDSRKITILKNLCELNLKIMDIMVVSPGVSIYNEGVKLAILIGVKVYGELEFANKFIKKNKIAVTGTNGKTTTVSLIKSMFDEAGKKSVLAGNIGEPVIGFVNKKSKNYIMEVSSFMLETIDTFQPHIACILNISNDHLDRHYTFENYLKTKLKISKNMSSKDYLVLNYEDENLRRYADEVIKPKIVWFSAVREVEGAFIKEGCILYKTGKKTYYICDCNDINLLGEHNKENVLCAVCVAMLSKIKTCFIKSAIKKFLPLEHRLEFVAEINGVKYYNDSKSTTVDSTLKAINSFSSKMILLVGGYDKQDDYNRLAKNTNSIVRITVIFGDNKNKIKECYERYHKPYLLANTLKEALTRLNSVVESGDTVLLSPSCASYDEFLNFEERGKFFKNYVRELNEKNNVKIEK